jgi:hypothetical protein
MPVLNTADKLYLGSSVVSAVYLGSTKVYPQFKPSQVAGLTVWLDADKLSSITTQWPDRSGTGHHGNVVGTPSPVVTADVLNSKSIVRFTASEGRIRNNSTGVSTDYTLVYLMRQRGGNVGRAFSAIYPPPNFLVGTHVSGWNCMYDNGWIKNAESFPPNPGPWTIFSADSITSGNLVRFFKDGVLQGTGVVAMGMGGTYAISGYDADNASESCDIDVAELMIWNRRLSGAERQQVEGYLKAKWAV